MHLQTPSFQFLSRNCSWLRIVEEWYISSHFPLLERKIISDCDIGSVVIAYDDLELNCIHGLSSSALWNLNVI